MKKRSFTLIEIMISLFILSLIGSFGVSKGWKMIREKRFSDARHKLENALLLSKVVAETYNVDVTLSFIKERGQLKLIKKTDDVPEKLKSFFKQEETLSYLELEDPKMEISFYASGFVKMKKEFFIMPIYDAHQKYCWKVGDYRFLAHS